MTNTAGQGCSAPLQGRGGGAAHEEAAERIELRKQLEKMLSWKVGVQTNFSVSVGKSAKYMQNIKLLFVLLTQLHAKPLAIGLAFGAHIHGNVKDVTLDHAHQLALRKLLLEM